MLTEMLQGTTFVVENLTRNSEMDSEEEEKKM